MKDDVAETVRNIWAELLDRDEMGPDSDFFDLGGDSILALNMLFRIHGELGVELPPGILFESSSLGAFIAAVAQARDAEAQEGII